MNKLKFYIWWFLINVVRKITSRIIYLAFKPFQLVEHPGKWYEVSAEKDLEKFAEVIAREEYIPDPINGLLDFTQYNPDIFFNKSPKGRDCIAHYEEVWVKESKKIFRRKIKDIQKGDMVLSYNFSDKELQFKEVIDKWRSGLKSICRVHYRNGTSSDMSEDHKLLIRKYAKTYKEVRVKDFKRSELKNVHKTPVIKRLPYIIKDHAKLTKPIWRLIDNLNSYFKRNYGYKDISETSIKKIDYINQKVEMYDIEVQDNHNFVLAGSGNIVHNCDDFAWLYFLWAKRHNHKAWYVAINNGLSLKRGHFATVIKTGKMYFLCNYKVVGNYENLEKSINQFKINELVVGGKYDDLVWCVSNVY